MQKVMPPILDFRYTNSPESEANLKGAYDRIFTIARQNILQAKEVNKETYMSKKYFIYADARYSKDWDIKDQIVETEVKTLSEFAQKHNLTVTRVFKDYEFDKKHLWDTELAIMMNAIWEKQAQGIICDSLGCFEVPEIYWRMEPTLKWLILDLGLEIITPGCTYKDGLPNGKLYVENEQEGAKY